MSLSNEALMQELQTAAKGHTRIVYLAIGRTPKRPARFFGLVPARRVPEDVMQTIKELLKEYNL